MAKASHPLLTLLEEGEVNVSRLSASTKSLLEPLRRTGGVERVPSARGAKWVLRNQAALRAVLAAQMPGLLAEVPEGVGPKARAIALTRNAHRGGSSEATAVLLKAPEGVRLVGPAGSVPVGLLTAQAGLAAFLLRDGAVWRLEGDGPLVLAVVENLESFLRAEALGVQADVWIYAHGRLSARLADWLGTLVEGSRELIHLGDYDPVGLDEYLRLRASWGGKARLHLPANLEDLFERHGNRGLLLKPRNQDLLGRLVAAEGTLPADAREVLRLIRQHNAGLEQEALVLG